MVEIQNTTLPSLNVDLSHKLLGGVNIWDISAWNKRWTTPQEMIETFIRDTICDRSLGWWAVTGCICLCQRAFNCSKGSSVSHHTILNILCLIYVFTLCFIFTTKIITRRILSSYNSWTEHVISTWNWCLMIDENSNDCFLWHKKKRYEVLDVVACVFTVSKCSRLHLVGCVSDCLRDNTV